MHTSFTVSGRLMRLGALSLMLAAGAALADTPAAPSSAPLAAPCARPPFAGNKMQPGVFMRNRLAHIATLLKLQPNQQAAWQEFVKAETDIATPRAFPPENANVVELSKFRAERMAQMADKMKAASRATARLWDKLTPDQRVSFDRLMQRGMPRMHGPMHGPMMQGGMGGAPVPPTE